MLVDTSFGIKIKNNLIYIDNISVNGLFSSNFVLDTGSELTVLDDDFVSKLKLSTGKKNISVADMEGNISFQKKILIDSLKIGEVLVCNLNGFIADLSSVGEKVDGIIGANFFKDKIWLFDFPTKRIHLLLQIDTNDYKYQIPLKIKKGLPYIDIEIANTVLKNVLIDIGNANRLSLAIKDSTLLKGKSDNDHYYTFLSNSVFNNKQEKVRIKESVFNSIHINKLRVDSCYAIFYGNVRAIGVPFLQESVIIIDYPNKKLYTNGLHQKNELEFGCRFIITEQGKIIVSSIRENSLAVKKGLLLGDELINVTNIELDSLKEMIRDESIYKKMDTETIIKRENNGIFIIIKEK
ncbi:hypothetical protein FACS189426_22820 [Bacteroidia bacterium]|nr:hypothetical protein FACS189426_22820 [Bacteroidia bacterium]